MNETMAPQAQENTDKMAQRLRSYARPAQTGATATNERLQEMNKKLPPWSLEPPYSFLR